MTIVGMLRSEWARVPNLDVPTESVTIQAKLSNGFLSTPVTATITYAPGERERLVAAVLGGEGSEADLVAARRILERRAQAIVVAQAELEKRYAAFEVAL